MVASKRDRIASVLKQMTDAAPFASLMEARSTLEQIMREVEDKFSGVTEHPNPDAALASDGRMYPPSDKFEIKQGCPLVRSFRHVGHKTSFGENGAVLIETLDGNAILDLSGNDRRRVADLLRENADERDREGKGAFGRRASGRKD